jgi:hypothetical protein
VIGTVHHRIAHAIIALDQISNIHNGSVIPGSEILNNLILLKELKKKL